MHHPPQETTSGGFAENLQLIRRAEMVGDAATGAGGIFRLWELESMQLAARQVTGPSFVRIEVVPLNSPWKSDLFRLAALGCLQCALLLLMTLCIASLVVLVGVVGFFVFALVSGNAGMIAALVVWVPWAEIAATAGIALPLVGSMLLN